MVERINIIIEELIGILLEVGLVLLLSKFFTNSKEFKENPSRLGLTDLRHLLYVDRIVTNEVSTFMDNILKFKDVVNFFL